MLMPDVRVRHMTLGDVHIAQVLLSQLRYPLDPEEVLRRFDAVSGSIDHVLLVAEQAGHLIALCHVYARPALDKPPEAVVQALVVDQTYRGSGVGKIMMSAAEKWAKERGFTSVALASSVSRTDAHAFYETIGYQCTSTSHLFRKRLD